ncbi:MAG: patatin-like phospholipase family protein [Myxococcales bacterium]|nr:patatin-like phospholipase family protein [Myxococcales bacterium]MCB9706818.1 patatin-like phospholipase family protein [Myxococcales bacterium]
MRDSSIGLILSGGGARGAYEVGVLTYIADALPDLLKRIRVITGSSVGAVNTIYLASRGLSPASTHELARLWRGLTIDDMISLSSLSALKFLGAAPLRLLRIGLRSPATGLLNAKGLWRKVSSQVQWSKIHGHVTGGRFDAVAVAATDISSGETHLFVDAAPGVGPTSPGRISEVMAIPARLSLRHVLASAAIPLLFSPVQLGDRWYMDGGVRHNTPLSPALHLGAQSLLIITVGGMRAPSALEGFPGIGQIVGKLLDSIFLDRVAFDLDRLARINDIVEAATSLGDDETLRFREALRNVGRPRYRKVPYAAVRPSGDLGAVASEMIRASSAVSTFSFVRVLNALFEDDAGTSGDAASFLFFDGSFADRLIGLGRADAARAHEQLAAL